MSHTCVDPALHVLEQLFLDYEYEDEDLKTSIRTAYLDLKFFKMFLWALEYDQQQNSDHGDSRFRYAWSNKMSKLKETAEVFRMKLESADVMIYHLRKEIEQYKPVLQEICSLVLDGDIFIKHFQYEELFLEYGADTTSLLDLIIDNLGVLDASFCLIAPMKQHFFFIDGKFKVFGKFAFHISCLACLCYVGKMDESLAFKMEGFISDLVRKYTPYDSKIVAMYLDLFKGRRYQKCEAVRGLAVSYVDFLLERLFLPSKDAFGIVHDGLVFLLSFVMDNYLENESEVKTLLLADIKGIICEVPSLISIHETELSDFFCKINKIMVQVKEMYVVRPLSSEFHSPETGLVGFFDSFLETVAKMLERKIDFTPSLKDQVITIHEELASLQHFLQDMFEPAYAHMDIKYGNANVVYFAAYVINLCSLAYTNSFEWYGRTCFQGLIEDIKLVKSKVIKSYHDEIMEGHEKVVFEMNKPSFTVQAKISMDKVFFIGYENDVEEIRNHLIRGTKDLRTISISGIPGQGKTTLAKKIYDEPSVKLHFHQRVWCHVSKECVPNILLLEIAREIGFINVDESIEIQDVVESIWRRLKGNRYLIVLDDIWDVDVWNMVQCAFPNDQNGSRILFTSRSDDLASQAGPNSIAHHLRLFSPEECQVLMRRKLSNYDGFPPEFSEIGDTIAELCRGLPLAIVLVGALLRRAGPVLNLWKQVALNLHSYLAGEGCMDIIELSYRYLPEHLKPCFLYLGAFPRFENIHVRKLKLLWIAEGFIKKNDMQSAQEYLDDLVSQNLVVVTKSSSRGGIKCCRVHHDLLYDLCLVKATEDNFLHLADESITSSFSSKRYDFHHRLCISYDGPFIRPKSTSIRKVLPESQIHSLMCFDYLEENVLSFFLWNFRVLRVLDFEESYLPTFPEAILQNIHLRYLALNGEIPDVPVLIIDLWNLETLIVKTNHSVGIPDTLWEMDSLKYICIISFSFDLRLIRTEKMAALVNIEVLKTLTLKYDLRTVEFLRRLVSLQKLKCTCGDRDFIHPMWFSMFGSLEKLESLDLHSDGCHVSQPLPTLNFPRNLRKLTLQGGFRLHWSAMSVVGKLPDLNVLKLTWNACAGTTWYLGDGEFAKLRYLKLFKMEEVERIDDSVCDDPFPCLEKLVLRHFEGLEEIPSRFGDICTLDSIDVTGSIKALDSAKRILEEQEDMGNDQLRVFGIFTSDAEDEEETNNWQLLSVQKSMRRRCYNISQM